MDELNNLRKEIEQIDKKLSNLLNERMQLSERIGELKTRYVIPIKDLDREMGILENVGANSKYRTYIMEIYKTIFHASCNIQLKIKRSKNMSDTCILVINPGSTSTKIAVFKNNKEFFKQNIKHSDSDLEKFKKITDQYEFRKETILKTLKEHNFDIATLTSIVGRGGLLRPLKSGVYEVNSTMLTDLESGKYGEHASNLGAIIANEIAKELNIKSYIVDPVCVDELEPLARFSGLKELPRTSIFHALNVKAVANNYAKSIGKKLNELNLIVAHMGGGITVSALKKGAAVEINHGIYEGPFSPERMGAMPTLPLIKYCKNLTDAQIKEIVAGKGGLKSLIGTSDAIEIEKEIEKGNKEFELAYEALAYQVAQAIGARAAVLFGKVDAIILTGGLAYSKEYLDRWITERVQFIAPIALLPGENEMEALAAGGFRVETGEEESKIY